jgi:hypothetical protein
MEQQGNMTLLEVNNSTLTNTNDSEVDEIPFVAYKKCTSLVKTNTGLE